MSDNSVFIGLRLNLRNPEHLKIWHLLQSAPSQSDLIRQALLEWGGLSVNDRLIDVIRHLVDKLEAAGIAREEVTNEAAQAGGLDSNFLANLAGRVQTDDWDAGT